MKEWEEANCCPDVRILYLLLFAYNNSGISGCFVEFSLFCGGISSLVIVLMLIMIMEYSHIMVICPCLSIFNN